MPTPEQQARRGNAIGLQNVYLPGIEGSADTTPLSLPVGMFTKVWSKVSIQGFLILEIMPNRGIKRSGR